MVEYKITLDNIFNQNYIYDNNNIIIDIKNDYFLNEENKNILINYYENEDNYLYPNTNYNFKDILCNIWVLINSLYNKDEVKKILNQLLIETPKCVTNIIYKLIDCCIYFSELVIISDNKIICDIIISIKNKLISQSNYNLDTHKELVRNKLIEKGYDKYTINQWLYYFI